MEYKKLSSGFEIPTLGLGTWLFGWRFEPEIYAEKDKRTSVDEFEKIIQYAISKWMTLIDTAELYAGWYTEEIIGKSIRNIPREKLFITSKIMVDKSEPERISTAIEGSLKRLWIDYLDLYLIHGRNKNFSLEQQMKKMNDIVQQNKTRYIGVSNFNTSSLKEARSYSEEPIVLNQVHYNFIFREPEADGLLSYCQNNDIILQAWRPVQYGELAKGNDFLKPFCEKYKKTPAQIAINWLISQKNVTSLFKTISREHLDENLDSIGWEMTAEDIEFIRKNFPNQQYLSNAVKLD